MKVYTLNLEFLNGVALARDLGHPNFRLKNVYVWDEGNKRFYMGTNGHIMFIAADELSQPTLNIEKPLALLYKGTLKGKKGENTTLVIDNEGRAEFMTSRENKQVEIIQCSPPEHWKECIPSEDSPKLEVYVCFNPDYLGRIRQFIGANVFTRPQTTENNGRSPVAWYAGKKLAVIMPIRLD